jgi:hypothetical protein
MENKATEIQVKLNGLFKKMSKAGYNDYIISQAIELTNELQQRGVQGLDRFVRKLSDNLGNKDNSEDFYESYLDIRKEGRFARILVRNGFKKIEIEYTKKGPDVKTRYNRLTIYFEITRKRENEEDEAIHQSKDGVGWISPYRLENILSTIQGKLKQLKDGELNIVVIWSDTMSFGTRGFEEAVKFIQQEIDTTPERYRKMGGILFTTGGVSYTNRTPKQFHLFSNDKADARLPNRLANKLQSMTEEEPSKLQKEYQDRAAAMRKHSH